MKSLTVVVAAFTLLIFSGCYTQLLVEDNPPSSQTLSGTTNDGSTIYANPIPQPILVPVYVPQPITGTYNSSGSQQISTPQRTSGDQRRSSDSSQPVRQENSRTSGTTRQRGR